MNKYIVIAFAFLGVWFYEASGGSDFEPGENTLVVFADPKPLPPREEPRVEMVARSDTSTSLTEIVPTRATDTTAGLTLVSVQPVPSAEPEPEVPVVAVEAEADVEASAPDPVAPEPLRDLRFVDGDRVNMRSGPGTDYAVVAQLLRNDMVEVLTDNGDGWLQLRDTISGQEGWMADWLVTASN